MTEDYLRDDLTPQAPVASNRIVGFFKSRENAYSAIRELRNAGFTSDQIGLAVADDDTISTETDRPLTDTSMWQEIKTFVTGADHEIDSSDYTDFRNSTDNNWDNDRLSYYRNGIENGGAVVTVIGTRTDEARGILTQHGADLRETGFDRSSFAGADLSDRDITGTPKSDPSAAQQQAHRIRVRGELRQRRENKSAA